MPGTDMVAMASGRNFKDVELAQRSKAVPSPIWRYWLTKECGGSLVGLERKSHAYIQRVESLILTGGHCPHVTKIYTPHERPEECKVQTRRLPSDAQLRDNRSNRCRRKRQTVAPTAEAIVSTKNKRGHADTSGGGQ